MKLTAEMLQTSPTRPGAWITGRSSLFLMTRFLLGVLVSLGWASWHPAVAQTASNTDPWAYCRRVLTDDALGTSNDVAPTVNLTPEISGASAPTFWRCSRGDVLVCAAVPADQCQMRDFRRRPNQGAATYCRRRSSGVMPASLQHRLSAYVWRCENGRPVRGPALTHEDLDGRGFLLRQWRIILPPLAPAIQSARIPLDFVGHWRELSDQCGRPVAPRSVTITLETISTEHASRLEGVQPTATNELRGFLLVTTEGRTMPELFHYRLAPDQNAMEVVNPSGSTVARLTRCGDPN